MLTCADCGKSMRDKGHSLPQGDATCHPCRAVRRAALPPKKQRAPRVHRGPLLCARCDAPMRKGSTSSPQGEAVCRPCRRANPASQRRFCLDCGAGCWRERCFACAQKLRRIRPDDDHRVTRAKRERSAPGLTWSQRNALRKQWVKWARRCAYCSELASTIDHVVPLARGGTNHEGNLVPACRPCNSSKGGRTIIEWRAGKRLPRTSAYGWVAKPDKPLNPKPVRLIRLTECRECHEAFAAKGHQALCSAECRKAEMRTLMRNRYRAKVGIALDAPLYSRAA